MREGESKKNGIKNGITIKQKMKLRVRSSETAPRNKFSKQQKVKEREKKYIFQNTTGMRSRLKMNL